MQSNHCRATAAAARLVGLEPHLVLVLRDREIDTEVGLAGNLLVERLLGSQLHLCAASDYLRYGGDLGAMDQINAAAAAQLTAEGRRPFVIPVGGTTPTGTWGYIEAVHELCVKRGELADLLDSTPFTKADILILHDPENAEVTGRRDLANFVHLREERERLRKERLQAELAKASSGDAEGSEEPGGSSDGPKKKRKKKAKALSGEGAGLSFDADE